MVEKPLFLKDIDEGIRNVDRILIPDYACLDQLVNRYHFLDYGGEAVVLKDNEKDLVLRIDYLNPAGINWTKSLIQKHYNNTNDEAIRLNIDLCYETCRSQNNNPLFQITPREVDALFRNRVAAHNAQYLRDPSSTVPINTLYFFNGRPFGMQMKFLDGRPLLPREFFADQELESLVYGLTSDKNSKNVLDEIKNSPHRRQIIDIDKFIPSDMVEVPSVKSNWI